VFEVAEDAIETKAQTTRVLDQGDTRMVRPLQSGRETRKLVDPTTLLETAFVVRNCSELEDDNKTVSSLGE
jgi:hypothetical protein